MRIISHWRDYYDGARAWGSDPSVVYVRERREHSWPDVRRAGDVDAALWSLRGMLAAVPSNPDFLAHGAVAFCGAVHPVWKVLESGKYRSSGMLWTLDQVEGALFGRHGSDGRALIDRLVDHPWGSWRWLSSNTYRSFMEHPPVIADEIHRLLRAPILLLDHVHGVVANPSLKGTGFEAHQRGPQGQER